MNIVTERRLKDILWAFENKPMSKTTQSVKRLLATAYEQERMRADNAMDMVRKLQGQVDSMTECPAAAVCSRYEVDLTPDILDPTVWVMKLKPMAASLRMLSSHPRHWDKEMLYQVGKQTAVRLSHMIWKDFATKMENDQ